MRINIEGMINALQVRYGVTAQHDEMERGYIAQITTGRGPMEVYFIPEGAKIVKPNGTSKFYYEVSNAKLLNYINKIVEFNNY